MTEKELLTKHGVTSYKIKISGSKTLYAFGDTEYEKSGETFLEHGKVAKKVEYAGIPKTLGRKWSGR